MIRTTIAAPLFFGALLDFATSLAAQSQQEKLQARYDRALAAGYKALFLCSAIGNAERVGATRLPESVEEWELTGIQPPLDGIIGELPYEIVRMAGRDLDYVSVDWADDMPPRIADRSATAGCSLEPIGKPASSAFLPVPVSVPRSIYAENSIRLAPLVPPPAIMEPVFAGAWSGEYGEGTRTTAVVVRRADAIVSERYEPDFEILVPQRTWSVAKSIAATLVGVAVHRGEADVAASAGLGVYPTDPRRAITIDHLLRMASGRYSDTPGNRTDPLYFGGSFVEETASHWPLIAQPGTVFRYANNDTLMAIRAIKESLESIPQTAFFDRLGMPSTVVEKDWTDDYILSSQVWSSARDLAALGQLYLDDGVLPSGERVLPEGWGDYVSSPSGPQPDGPFGYGAGFWLLNNSEGVPPDTFAAMGNRGQYVVIVPSRDVVIVRRGEDPAGTRFEIAAFARDVLAALE